MNCFLMQNHFPTRSMLKFNCIRYHATHSICCHKIFYSKRAHNYISIVRFKKIAPPTRPASGGGQNVNLLPHLKNVPSSHFSIFISRDVVFVICTSSRGLGGLGW